MAEKIYGKAPLTYTSRIKDKVDSLTFNCCDEPSKAEAIFDWMQANIQYEDYKKGIIAKIFADYSYKSAHQVFDSRKGICLDQAYLYTVMARQAGLEAKMIEVTCNYKGEKIWHGCSSVWACGRRILVDTAYCKFDIRHKECKVMEDNEVFAEYARIKHLYEQKNIEYEPESRFNFSDFRGGLREDLNLGRFGGGLRDDFDFRGFNTPKTPLVVIPLVIPTVYPIVLPRFMCDNRSYEIQEERPVSQKVFSSPIRNVSQSSRSGEGAYFLFKSAMLLSVIGSCAYLLFKYKG